MFLLSGRNGSLSQPEMTDPNLEPELKHLDSLAHEILLESRKPDVYMYVCKLCYVTPTTSLYQCFKKNSTSDGPGNIPNHLMTLHKEAYEKYIGKQMSAKKEKKRGLSGSDKSDNATPTKQARQDSSQVSIGASALISKRGQSTPPLADMSTAVSVASSITDSFSHYD
jgi:hypothetical protein